ncbi:hypothetical protein AVEN_155039-1 [Araneus ventricosus]|uniref:Uncharacterized protein n=1 Tax=Araneus ventricosus TaxID=182803 RepID=A0A4Y2A7D3_ARAVE|nr:hypothetical protein AVEN_155039-1 [Araneus ventricosus]
MQKPHEVTKFLSLRRARAASRFIGLIKFDYLASWRPLLDDVQNLPLYGANKHSLGQLIWDESKNPDLYSHSFVCEVLDSRCSRSTFGFFLFPIKFKSSMRFYQDLVSVD